MKKTAVRLSVIAVLLMVAGVCSPCEAATVSRTSTGRAERIFVKEWEEVSAVETDIAVMSKEQILAELQKGLEGQKALRLSSWEARYLVTSRQAAQRDKSIPEIIKTSRVHLISNGTKWFYENQEEVRKKTVNENYSINYYIASNGEVVTTVWPGERRGQVRSIDQYGAVSKVSPTLADFLLFLPAESSLRGGVVFPDILEVLSSPDTKLLPWYTGVGGHTCYVIEGTTERQKPLFNPNSGEVEEGVVRSTIRLAIDPHAAFMIVRWAQVGLESEVSGFRRTANGFPGIEIKYSHFREAAKGAYIPWEMTFTQYTGGPQEQKSVAKQTHLVLEEFAVNKKYPAESFEFDFPKGYSLIDRSRGITYTIGDSKEKINALVAAAKARDAFYKKLSQTQAPFLEPNEWINSAPIVLTEQKGRPIILHFWSLGCAPSMHELPMLQRQYGHSAGSPKSHLFVSIHPFADGQDMRQLKRVIKKYGITFPVMVDSSDPEIRSWGKTFKRYRVFSVPTEVRIDQNGYFAGIDKEIISTNNWWMENPDISNALYDKEK